MTGGGTMSGTVMPKPTLASAAGAASIKPASSGRAKRARCEFEVMRDIAASFRLNHQRRGRRSPSVAGRRSSAEAIRTRAVGSVQADEIQAPAIYSLGADLTLGKVAQ
jgi:hypothetical protein